MPDIASSVLLCAVEGTELTDNEFSFYSKNTPAGFTLFSRNIPEKIQETVFLTKNLQKLGSNRILIAIDQEGGRVRRIKGDFPDRGPAFNLCNGATDRNSLLQIEDYGYEVGSALKELGINTNFAPVVDVLTNQNNPAIGDRAFSSSAKAVVERAGAFLRGQNRSGIMSCLKHFPGQGAAIFDTHLKSSIISETESKLVSEHLLPFNELHHEVEMIMVSHCIYTEWDALNPASVSKRILQQILLQDLDFKGLVLSDDFNMGAIAQDDKSWQEAVLTSFVAGCDLLLVCRHLDRVKLAYSAIQREIKRSPAFAQRIAEASNKVMSVLKKL